MSNPLRMNSIGSMRKIFRKHNYYELIERSVYLNRIRRYESGFRKKDIISGQWKQYALYGTSLKDGISSPCAEYLKYRCQRCSV